MNDVVMTSTRPLLREALGAVLRTYRLDANRTLRDVAETARVSSGYLSELERGRKEVSSEVLRSICDALGVNLAVVLLRAASLMGVEQDPRLRAAA
ncbi:helix-turn-helix transcriptional regulator [Lawsonella clevelandensis]|uniref:helix-turn-helix domain-containing protein n=1 Tax=Lawsonella clevelandensis TaxID=1528099 RepID=UPI00290E58A4|nr:helix-turn-helix transcriptional regulator [Lawsonella clevelandensis]MDU7193870.1 helix-turn-helix transcriptional regulator [Lawsonella clevelandensis]